MDSKTVSSNFTKLKELLTEILLLDESEFQPNLTREAVDTWDSLAVVAIAVGIEETFGYHLTPEEATSIDGVPAIVAILEKNRVSFEGM